MGKINWGRVILSGLLTAVVWGVLYAITLPLVEGPVLLPDQLGRAGQHCSTRDHIDDAHRAGALGHVALRGDPSALRSRSQDRGGVGLGHWFFSTWVDTTWIAFKAMPPRAFIGPAAANLPITLVATMAGAWLYKETNSDRTREAAAGK